MRNYEILRERPAYERDIYNELKRIEERGKRLKPKKNGWSFRINKTTA